jgi:enediyne biosynthesis protein E4
MQGYFTAEAQRKADAESAEKGFNTGLSLRSLRLCGECLFLICLTTTLLLAAAGCGRRAAVPGSAAAAGEVGGHSSGSAAGPAIRFENVAEQAGVRFKHTSGRSGRLLLPETMGSGCAFLDYDGDGRLDLYLVNGAPLPGSPVKGPVYGALYRNRGDGTFEDVTKRAGLAIPMYGNGCAVGDYDNDGHDDLFVSCLGPDHLFHNNGNGTFTDVTARAGVSDPYYSTSCAWFDYDRDGRLDLFVGNYCKWSPALNKICKGAFGEYMCPPEHYKGDPPRLYHNRGDGTFEDVTRKSGIFNAVGKNLGVVVFDADHDGWPDLMVANDLEPNLLYRNNHDGTFREIGVEAGVAYSSAGKARAGMGIDTADFANDGREAIVIGNNTREGLALFVSDAPGPGPHEASASSARDAGGDSFTDLADTAGLYAPSLPFLTFGTLFVDLDNDGRKDIFAVNGNVNERIERTGENTAYAQRPMLFHNEGGGRFVEIASQAGAALQTREVARGLAAGDYDADGDLDLLVSVCNGKAMLLRNETPHANHWLSIRTRGTKSNRDGIGTRVTLEAGGVRQQGWVRSGSSYCSASDLVAWFGLGSASTAERITLRWPNGEVQTLTNVAADREILVQEGRGIVERGARRLGG